MNEILTDNYSQDVLISRFTKFKNMYISDEEFIKGGLKIRHQNTPGRYNRKHSKVCNKKI